MFYAHFVLAKKGPLARIWLAAHWDKKLTKMHVLETDIESSVKGILAPKVKLALRTSGHLLLGITRIYSRKAKYLLTDCNEAFIKIKMAFRPGVVDLPEGNREAAVATITLPEVFHDFDTAMPDITIDMDAQVTLNQSRAEDITLKEDYGTLTLMNEDVFGFEEVENVRDAIIDESFDQTNLLFDDDRSKPSDCASTSAMTSKHSILDPNSKDDGFPGQDGNTLAATEKVGLFEASNLFEDASFVGVDNEMDSQKEKQADAAYNSDDDMFDSGPASMGLPSPPSSPATPPGPSAGDLDKIHDPNNMNSLNERQIDLFPSTSDGPSTAAASTVSHMAAEISAKDALDMPPPPVPPILDRTTLLQNEEESFALAPLDAMIMHGAERTVKTKRKRKLIVDEVKNISGEEMKSQLSDTTDIVTSLDLAPPTKRLMHWKETGGVEKLFALPGHNILSKTLSRIYQRHLTTRSVENEDYGDRHDRIELDAELDQQDEAHARKKRRTDDGHPMDSMQHLEVPRMSYGNYEPQGLDVPPNFLQEPMFHNLTDDPSSVIPPPQSAQSIHSMLSPDMNPLSHMPPMMHPSSVDPSLQMHSMHDLPSDSFAMPTHPSVPQNLIPDAFSLGDTIIQPPEKTGSLLDHPFADPMDKNTLSSCVNGPSHNLDIFASGSGSMQELSEAQPLSSIGDLSDSGLHMNRLNAEPQEAGVSNLESLQAKSLAPQDDSDDDDDYGAPSSVGPMCPEEQLEDETYEQFEERILSKRTTHMLHIINNQLDQCGSINFSGLTRNNKRKQVAQKFYTFLVLKKQQAVELRQNEPYGELVITKGPKFDSVYNAN